MAIPVYLWLYDDAGNLIKGSVDVVNREHSIEILGLNHAVFLPTDNLTGKISSLSVHNAICFDKEIDSSSPGIYKAITSGLALKRGEFRFYQINDSGFEEHYYSMLLEGIRIISGGSMMYNIRDGYGEERDHLECIEITYERLTHHYIDGSIIHADSWNERKTA